MTEQQFIAAMHARGFGEVDVTRPPYGIEVVYTKGASFRSDGIHSTDDETAFPTLLRWASER